MYCVMNYTIYKTQKPPSCQGQWDSPIWQQASVQLKHCQTLNRANSCVISHLQKRLARLTEIFRGATGQDKLYGAKGQEQAVSHSNVLASA